MKRFLGILLVLLVLVFAVPASMSVLASEEDLTITAGEVRIVESIDGEIVFLRFVPGVSGTYNFSADSGMDTVGYLYDENNNLLEEHDDGDTSDCSVTYELCADTVYYWGVKLYSYCTNAPFPVEVVCIDSACTHDNVTQCEMQAATCTSYGYTAGDFCEDCKTWISHCVTLSCVQAESMHT